MWLWLSYVGVFVLGYIVCGVMSSSKCDDCRAELAVVIEQKLNGR